MNNSFDIHRFGKLVWHDVRRCLPQFSINGIILVLTLAFVPMMEVFQNLADSTMTYGASDRLAMIVVMAMLASSELPIQLYANVGRKMKRGDIYFAMLPASKLEKFLSIALLSMVLVPLALLVAQTALDSLLTLLHMPFYHRYLWQSRLAGMLNLPMLLCCLLAFVGPTFGIIYANAVRNKTWRVMVCTMMWLWLLGGLVASQLFDADMLWIVVGIQLLPTVLMAFLGWNKMNKMGY